MHVLYPNLKEKFYNTSVFPSKNFIRFLPPLNQLWSALQASQNFTFPQPELHVLYLAIC